jgi:hypothetical protein
MRGQDRVHFSNSENSLVLLQIVYMQVVTNIPGMLIFTSFRLFSYVN